MVLLDPILIPTTVVKILTIPWHLLRLRQTPRPASMTLLISTVIPVKVQLTVRARPRTPIMVNRTEVSQVVQKTQPSYPATTVRRSSLSHLRSAHSFTRLWTSRETRLRTMKSWKSL
jgi:hypothetical protein